TFTLDVRHAQDAVRARVTEALLSRARDIGKRRKLAMEARSIGENAAVHCAPRLVTLLSQAVKDCGQRPIELTSGAGHDAVVMSSLTDIAMLFVRCKGGISHNPAESVSAADVAVAIEVVNRFIELLAKS